MKACFTSLSNSILFLALSCLCASADTTLVSPGDLWQYRKGTSAPQADWTTAPDSALDSTWLTGPGGFGYADNSPETAACPTLLNDMRGNYTTLAFRKSFQVDTPIDPSLHLELTMDFDDGFIAWLDGTFLVSANAPGAPTQPAYNAIATDTHESSRGNSSPNPPMTYDLGAVQSRLAAGPHILSILGLNQSSTSSDFIQIATLTVVTNTLPTNCISGVITQDTTWQAASGPYALCGSLIIASNATLTVEAGTTIYLGPGVDLTVANGGRIVAEGTSTNRIRFTAPAGSTAWGGISIEGQGESPESRFAYVDFEGNGTVCLEVAGGTVYLDHATFGTTTHQYVSLDSSSFLISHCYFPSSTVSFELVHGTGGIKAGGHGIVRDCYFGTTSNYNDIMDFTGGNRPNQPIIQYYSNVFSGGSDDILDLDGTDAWIEGNIFLHSHKNGTTPDSSAAISGGSNGSATSEITILGNLFFDCDQAATAKQGNFYTFLNNTIVHTTNAGGIDTASGVVNVRDLDPSPTTFGAGYYLEGNIVVDAPQLVRNYVAGQTTVTFVNNILPMPWTGPGASNLVADPLLKHIPTLAETHFTNWTDAQVMWDWFSLLPVSPGLGTGPNGRDLGGVIPFGVSISGEPSGVTAATTATLTVGINRSGDGIPATSWTEGSGFTGYRWQLDGGTWSAEVPIHDPIVLTNLTTGPHQVGVVGRNDAGFYQNDPALGTNAVVSLSRIWTVGTVVNFTSETRSGTNLVLSLTGEPGRTYTVEFKNTLTDPTWSRLSDVTTDPQSGTAQIIEPMTDARERFYRLSRPTP